MPVCPRCRNKSDETFEYCEVCGAMMGELREELNAFAAAIDSLTDELVAGSFAMTTGRGHDILAELVSDMDSVNWNVISIESVLFFQHVFDRYARELHGPHMRDTVIGAIETPLMDKLAKAGGVRPENIVVFEDMYINNLRQREIEYNAFNLEEAMINEISEGRAGRLIEGKDRIERFAEILLSVEDIVEAGIQDTENTRNSLLWRFTNRITKILGEPENPRVQEYIHRYTITFLFLTVHPLKELLYLKELMDAGNTG